MRSHRLLSTRYREGQEDQLGSLGLVVNVIVLWNTIYIDAALDQLRAEISELRGQRVDVARFKQITGLSRKYAIPLLEYLDRQMITRKVGDQRLVI